MIGIDDGLIEMWREQEEETYKKYRSLLQFLVALRCSTAKVAGEALWRVR